MGSDTLESIVKKACSGKQCSFPKEIREFALTLQYYSPRAYLYVRKSFSNILPHPRTLRRWYTVVDGKPGFTLEALEAIKQKVAAGHVYCNLTVDEMCVKRHIEVDTHQNVYGHVNMGTNVVYDCDEIPVAKNALVFLVVGMNGYWKMPVGYFLIDALTGIERGNLLAKAIELITETGANLHSVTFDGASVNLSMCTSLGADLNTNTPYIQNPNTFEKILVFHDQAHMIKLIRNTFGDKKILKNGDGKLIQWKFIEKLFEKEQEEGLKLATKLTSRHVKYQNEKMNVRLASQVLSQSVSDALLYLKSEDPNFEGCEATAEFCSMVNNAFDIMNSRKLYSKKPYNSAISTKTFDQYKQFTNAFTNYIENLEFLDGLKIVESRRKTGFRGMIMGLHSALELFKILQLKSHITFLITYKLSQDHLETFFSAVRSRGGYNDNPTCRQFQAAYKRLLVHNTIVGSMHGNCTILDSTKTLSVTSVLTNDKSEEKQINIIESHDHDYFGSAARISSYVEDVSIYIAGFVAMKLEKKIFCDTCRDCLISTSHESKLAQIKDRGGLKKPSKCLQTVCIESEKIFMQYSTEFINKKKSIKFFIVKVKLVLYNKYSIFNNMFCVNNDIHMLFDQTKQFDTHRDHLIKNICVMYYNIRLFHEVRKANDQLKLRSKLTKLVHFRHE